MTIDEIEKSVNGKYPVGKVYKEPDLDTAETITAVTVTFTPASELATEGAVVIAADGKSFSWVITGGLAATGDYLVQFKVTTSSGKVFEHPIREAIKVKIVS